MGEVAGCMDLEEAGLSRSLPHIPAAGARGALRWAGSVLGGCGRRDAAPAPQQVGLRGACATPHSGLAAALRAHEPTWESRHGSRSVFPGECGSRPGEASGVPRSQSEASRAALSPQGRRGRAQCWPGTRRVSVPTPPTVRLGVGDRVTGVHEHQLAPQWSTGGLQWRGEGRPVGAWPGEGRHRASRGAQAHGKGLVQGSVDTEGGPSSHGRFPHVRGRRARL